MSKLHYDHKFNKALAISIVFLVVFTLIGGWWSGILSFIGFWIGYNFDEIYGRFADA